MLALAVTTAAWGQTTLTTNITVNTVVPDNNPNGLATALTIAGLSGPISSVTATVDITGGFNGDLYAYLVGPGGFAVLLNRTGQSLSSPYGYSDQGFNVTFSDTAVNGNIHFYQNTVIPTAGGQLTGTWAPDGGSLSSFDGTDPNGQWAFFIADLSAGGVSTLQSVGLTILTVPEPQTWAMLGSGLSLFWLMRKRK